MKAVRGSRCGGLRTHGDSWQAFSGRRAVSGGLKVQKKDLQECLRLENLSGKQMEGAEGRDCGCVWRSR